MTVICRAYNAHDAARAAVEGLLAAGVPGDTVRVLMGEAARDAAAESEGQFAGATAPEDPVGDFGGAHPRAAGEGAYAGSAAAQRTGSFADADRETLAAYPGGAERVRIVSHREIRQILLDAGLDRATADRDAEELHAGRILVLADVGDRSEDDVRAALGER